MFSPLSYTPVGLCSVHAQNFTLAMDLSDTSHLSVITMADLQKHPSVVLQLLLTLFKKYLW